MIGPIQFGSDRCRKEWCLKRLKGITDQSDQNCQVFMRMFYDIHNAYGLISCVLHNYTAWSPCSLHGPGPHLCRGCEEVKRKFCNTFCLASSNCSLNTFPGFTRPSSLIPAPSSDTSYIFIFQFSPAYSLHSRSRLDSLIPTRTSSPLFPLLFSGEKKKFSEDILHRNRW